MSNGVSSQAEQARENARETDGKFGTYDAGESGASLVPDRHPESAAADEQMHQRIPGIFNGPYEDHRAIGRVDSLVSTDAESRIAIRQAAEQMQPEDPYDDDQMHTFDDRMDHVAESILDDRLKGTDLSELAAEAMDEIPSSEEEEEEETLAEQMYYDSADAKFGYTTTAPDTMGS